MVPGVDDVGGGRPLVAHAHVQRPVAHEGEAALGLVQLHGRDADVEDHAVQPGLAAVREGLGQAREGGADQLEAIREVARHGLGEGLHRRVAIQGHDLGAALQDGAGVAAGAEGGVDDDVARLGIERRDHLGQQDGGVGRGHAAPPGFAAAAWRRISPNCLRPSRAMRRCSARWAAHLSLFQIWKRSPTP
ncbi:hypothetical protein D3C77_506130 [compost metagenome]